MPKIAKSHSTPYFERKFEKLPKNLQKVAARKILLFEQNPSHPGLNTHKLKGHFRDIGPFILIKITEFYLDFWKIMRLSITILILTIFTNEIFSL